MKVKSFRLNEEQEKQLNTILKKSGLSLSELIIKKVLEDNSQKIILDQIDFESISIQDKIESEINKFKEEYRKDMKTFGEVVTKSFYRTFYKVVFEEKDKRNIYTYSKGDLLKSSKNVLFIVVSVNENENEIKLTAAPLTSNPKFITVNVLEKGDTFLELYRQ